MQLVYSLSHHAQALARVSLAFIANNSSSNSNSNSHSRSNSNSNNSNNSNQDSGSKYAAGQGQRPTEREREHTSTELQSNMQTPTTINTVASTTTATTATTTTTINTNTNTNTTATTATATSVPIVSPTSSSALSPSSSSTTSYSTSYAPSYFSPTTSSSSNLPGTHTNTHDTHEAHDAALASSSLHHSMVRFFLFDMAINPNARHLVQTLVGLVYSHHCSLCGTIVSLSLNSGLGTGTGTGRGRGAGGGGGICMPHTTFADGMMGYRRYGTTNPMRKELFDFLPRLFMRPLHARLRLQEGIIHTQHFISLLDKKRREDLALDPVRKFIAEWFYRYYIQLKREGKVKTWAQIVYGC